MKVPFIDLTRFEVGFLARWSEKNAEMTVRAEFIGGAEVLTLERRLQEYLQVNYAMGCANGTDALQLALRAMGVGRGDVVLVPNLTFWATFESVINVGGDPVTVDASPQDGGVDFHAFEQAILSLKPKAAIVAHLYGWGSERLADIRALCKKHNVMLLEDGAQCLGVTYQDSPIYKDAYISTTSFYPAKVLGAAGDGGAVFTNDAALADKVRSLGNHGRTSHYGYGDVGWNSRLDAFQAAFLNISLDYIEDRLLSRRQAVAYYHKILPEIGLTPLHAPKDYLENGYCNVCLVTDQAKKQSLEATLKASEIGFANIYPGVMSAQKGAIGYHKAHFGGTHAEMLCQSVVNLPLYPYMTEAELDRVATVVRNSSLSSSL